MNRVMKRTWLMGLFVMILVAGLAVFLGEYWHSADRWISTVGSPHIYKNNNISTGVVTDRQGSVLLDLSGGRTYSDSAATRKSTLHWLGDRYGHISATAVSTHAGAMIGFDHVNGIYGAAGSGGIAELTISEKAQNTALEAMAGRKGTVAVYNYRTGQILCAVTTPTYDPDQVPDIAADTKGTYEGVYLNRFTQVTYTPGSIFKVVTAAAALEHVEGIQDMTFRCTGTVEYGEGDNIATVTCENVHGNVSLKTALASSCNCAFAQIAELIGKDNMIATVKQLQVTEPVVFDGITTAAGKYDLARTAPVSFAWSCIGQHTDLVNPARFMTLMGAIAGGGQGAQPYIVSRVTNGENETYAARTEMTQRVLSREVAETLKQYLRSNVKNVYGDWRFPELTVCGKSGTSQLGGDQVSNALFAGFATDEDYPLAFICVIENGGYGASECIPVLSRVLSVCKDVLDG